MPITDANIMTVGLLLFAQMFLFAMGERFSSIFGILSGFFGILFAVVLWDILTNLVVSAAFGVIAVLLIINGFDGFIAERRGE